MDAVSNSTQAFVVWYTLSTPSTSQVFWGTTPQLGNATAVNSALVNNHSVTVNGLQPNTTYYFQAVSVDANGNVSVSDVISKATTQ